jgi:hypothetical protein
MAEDRRAGEPETAEAPAAQEKAGTLRDQTEERAGEPVDAGPRIRQRTRKTQLNNKSLIFYNMKEINYAGI